MGGIRKNEPDRILHGPAERIHLLHLHTAEPCKPARQALVHDGIGVIFHTRPLGYQEDPTFFYILLQFFSAFLRQEMQRWRDNQPIGAEIRLRRDDIHRDLGIMEGPIHPLEVVRIAEFRMIWLYLEGEAGIVRQHHRHRCRTGRRG